MSEKNYYYYDLQIMNNSNSDDYQLTWEDRKSSNIIQYNPDKKYSMMVNQLILDTDGIVLFLFTENKYRIKIKNSTTLVSNEQYITFNVATDSIYPTKSDYRKFGIYYIYQFVIMFNRTLVLALQGAGYAGTELVLQYDPDTKMFFLNRTSVNTELDIQINSNLIYLFNGFYCRKVDDTYWSLLMIDTTNLVTESGGRKIYRSEYSCTDNWRQVGSINMYLTNNLYITNSFSYKYDYNQLNYSQNKEKSQMLLKIFYPEINYYDSRIRLSWKASNYPSGLKNIESKSLSNVSFSQLSFRLTIELTTGEEYPIYLDKATHLLGELLIEESN